MAFWGKREQGSVVSVYVSSHRKLIVTEMHIACRRSPQLLTLSAGRAHARKCVSSVLSDVPLSAAVSRAENWALIRVIRSGSSAPMALATWSLSPPFAQATNDRPAMLFQPSIIIQLHMQHYRSTLDVFHRASPIDTHAAGLLWFLAISIYTLAVRDISLASISYEVSDDSLSRLVVHISCRVSLPTSNSTVCRPIGGGGRHALCNTHATYEILNKTLKY